MKKKSVKYSNYGGIHYASRFRYSPNSGEKFFISMIFQLQILPFGYETQKTTSKGNHW